MACRLAAVSFDSADPLWLARFWGELLGWRLAGGPSDCATLVPGDGVRFWFQFRIAPAQDPGRNERHLPLTSSSAEDQRQTLAKALGLGAHPLDVGQRPEEGHVVLADPEGNEFCVIEPGNKYLADCGFLAKITCAGSRQVGSFWSEVLAWPLVWDQGLQTAIQSPQRGRESPATRRECPRHGGTASASSSLRSATVIRKRRPTASLPSAPEKSVVARIVSPSWRWPIQTVVSSTCKRRDRSLALRRRVEAGQTDAERLIREAAQSTIWCPEGAQNDATEPEAHNLCA